MRGLICRWFQLPAIVAKFSNYHGNNGKVYQKQKRDNKQQLRSFLWGNECQPDAPTDQNKKK